MTAPNPGWYPHPNGSGQLAYWTGDEWDFTVAQEPTQAMTHPFPPTGLQYNYSPAKPKSKWPVAVIAATGILVLALVIALAVSSQKKPDDQAQPSPQPTTSQVTKPPSSSRTPTTTQSRSDDLHDWGMAAMPEFNAMQSAFEDISTAADNRDLSAMASSCSDLSGAVAKLRQKLPTPDPEVTTELTAALDAYGRGAATCSLVDTGSVTEDQLMQAADDLQEGNSRLAAATALIKAAR